MPGPEIRSGSADLERYQNKNLTPQQREARKQLNKDLDNCRGLSGRALRECVQAAHNKCYGFSNS